MDPSQPPSSFRTCSCSPAKGSSSVLAQIRAIRCSPVFEIVACGTRVAFRVRLTQMVEIGVEVCSDFRGRDCATIGLYESEGQEA